MTTATEPRIREAGGIYLANYSTKMSPLIYHQDAISKSIHSVHRGPGTSGVGSGDQWSGIRGPVEWGPGTSGVGSGDQWSGIRGPVEWRPGPVEWGPGTSGVETQRGPGVLGTQGGPGVLGTQGGPGGPPIRNRFRFQHLASQK
ncbi:hypothetical protein NHX12_021273 [Muraenolepis orangiensis]|uniref:Uncharacterized protein n=1 Tax=Muraenolepis orangiensis TaxID=630683 RepID=A0A9Q0EPR8_9TELE|nr:hypothetical protein NHX12_021273 [Muraenolepis orangiensis]